MRLRTGVITAAALAAGGLGGWELLRRRDLNAVRADPLWYELNRTVHGRERRVRSADGTELHVETHGDDAAPPVVLSHGWMESVELWQLVVRDLSRSHRVITYDQRGHGRSAIPEGISPYTPDHLVDDLDAVLAACLRPDERCVVAGHSMGGMTIVAWAGRHRGRVQHRLRGAVLVNTATHEMVGQSLVLGPLAGARVHTALVPRVLPLYRPLTTQLEPVSYRVVKRVVAGDDTTPAQIAFYHRMFLSCPAPVTTGFGHMFLSLDLRTSVDALDVPAVVIAGHDDRLLPPLHSQRLAEALPELMSYTELDGVGHMAPIEAPRVIADAVRSLSANAAAAAASPSTSRSSRRRSAAMAAAP